MTWTFCFFLQGKFSSHCQIWNFYVDFDSKGVIGCERMEDNVFLFEPTRVRVEEGKTLYNLQTADQSLRVHFYADVRKIDQTPFTVERIALS